MSACVFCDIVSGESPATGVEDWGPALSFDPIGPHVPGHKLIIPKTHINDATEDPYIASIAFLHAVKYANRYVQGPVNILTSVGAEATQSVFHLHYHVIPRGSDDGLPSRWPWIAESAESERDALREKVARVEALRDQWRGESSKTAVGMTYLGCGALLNAALSDPTTPYRALLASSPAEGTGEAGCECGGPATIYGEGGK